MPRVRYALLAAVALFVAPAMAQDARFPSKPVRLITLTSAGGTLDMLARLIADEAGKQFGQTVSVENRVGAGGNIGAQMLARAEPDGHTIGMVTVSTHGINPTLYGDKMRFDPINDFAFITIAALAKNVVVVHPSLQVKNVTELADYARKNPEALSFGSAGSGTSQHLSGEMVKMVANVKMTHVPYRGASAAMPDLLAGRIQVMFIAIPEARQHIAAGTLRAIGLTSKARSISLPDVIPMAEQEGFAGFDVSAWFAVAAPAKTPRVIVDRYNKIIGDFLRRPDINAKLEAAGLDVVASSPEAMAEFVKEEIARWAPVVKASGAIGE